MKYKLVVKSNDKTWVEARNKSKDHLEKRGIALSRKKPRWTVYVCSEQTRV